MDFVKSYWRILFALAISVVIAVRAYVGVEVLTVTDLAKAMGVALAALVGLHLAESLDLSIKFRQSRDDLRDDLSRVINAADRYATRIVEFRGQSDYDDLFDGLTGNLYSYNPHQFSDKTLLLREESIVESMRKRYAESAFTQALFLICVGDEYGQRNLARFVLRLKKVALAGGEEHVCKKVQVKVSTKAFIEEATFHLQDKHGHRAVAELRLRGLTRPGLPIPRHYLVTQVDSVRKNFLDYFEQEWASAKLVTTKDLLALVDRRQTEDQAYEKVRRELLSEVVD